VLYFYVDVSYDLLLFTVADSSAESTVAEDFSNLLERMLLIIALAYKPLSKVK
jgi:hypothetical protein